MRHWFILEITYYFSKWVEVVPMKEVMASDVVQFIKHHIKYHFGVMQRIVHDSGPQFIDHTFQRIHNKFRIQCISSKA